MRLAAIEIRDFRSIYRDDITGALSLDLAPGMNTLVGLNNCGKSNVLRAVSLALDPHHPFDPEIDAPGPRPFALPIITLRFEADDSRADDKSVLDAALEYERGLGSTTTHAEHGTVALEVAFQPTADGPRRRERLLTPAGLTPSTEDDAERLGAALARLRSAVRFVLISSGESIASVLEGNFREILHSVVRERLQTEFSAADQSRQDYVSGLQEHLLAPLRDRLTEDVQRLFPEIFGIRLSPDVPSIERTLSNVGVHLEDLVATPLDQKGTGVRAGVLVAMLGYLALNATKAMVFAIEEPESFLHPAAQEDLRDRLEALAQSDDVSLLVTTHSPYLVSRSSKGRVYCLAKDTDGRTRIAQAAPGDTPHASLIGDLFRQSSLEELLARATNLPDGAQGILLVEGEGDEFCLKTAASVVGRPDLIDGIHVQPAGSASKVVAQAVIARAATDRPVMVLLDNDEAGKDALKTLTSDKFRFQKNSQVISYATVFPPDERDFPYEAEDVFSPEIIQALIDEHGEAILAGKGRRPDGEWHFDLDQSAKGLLPSHLESQLLPKHVERWIELILLIRDKLGLPTNGETAAAIVAAAPEPPAASSYGGSTLIVTDDRAYPRYQASSALLLNADVDLPADLTHVGFYVGGAIQPEIASVVADYTGLFLSEMTAAQLRSSAQPVDQRAADLIDDIVRSDPSLAQRTHRLLLLSDAADPSTLTLSAPVKNTKQHAGRPLAWAVGSRVLRTTSLAQGPATTDELDDFELGGQTEVPSDGATA